MMASLPFGGGSVECFSRFISCQARNATKNMPPIKTAKMEFEWRRLDIIVNSYISISINFQYRGTCCDFLRSDNGGENALDNDPHLVIDIRDVAEASGFAQILILIQIKDFRDFTRQILSGGFLFSFRGLCFFWCDVGCVSSSFLRFIFRLIITSLFEYSGNITA